MQIYDNVKKLGDIAFQLGLDFSSEVHRHPLTPVSSSPAVYIPRPCLQLTPRGGLCRLLPVKRPPADFPGREEWSVACLVRFVA